MSEEVVESIVLSHDAVDLGPETAFAKLRILGLLFSATNTFGVVGRFSQF